MIRLGFALVALTVAPPLAAAPAQLPRVDIKTDKGDIVVELEVKKAPITAGNFLKYIDGKKLEGTTFYRAARAKGDPKIGFIQGGIQHNIGRSFPPIKHEPTSKTGLHHVDGTISMARTDPGTAMGDFFIIVGSGAAMDAKGSDLGYAAFGRVVKGMDVVKRILAAPTVKNAGSGSMKGQYIEKPVKIVSTRRLP
jgi:peptidyl-prolyl cis-trans isomerase A (cyclophilin A)